MIRRTTGLLVVVFTLAAADGPDRLRLGVRFYEKGDYAAALECFQQAEAEGADPELVAYNQAAALYKLGRYQEASSRYRRTLETAKGLRQLRARYGLANSLNRQAATQSAERAVNTLAQACREYRACLALTISAEEDQRRIREDAAHNLALAQQALDRRLKEKEEEQKQSLPGHASGNDKKDGTSGTGSGQKTGDSAGQAEKKGEQPKEGTLGSSKAAPGRGGLPLLLDDRDAPPLTSEFAREHLRRHLERMQRDRSRNRGAELPLGTVRDW